jgi:hypothetical protein
VGVEKQKGLGRFIDKEQREDTAKAKEKDERKKERVAALQQKRLFGIAEDLAVPIVVDGVDLIAQSKMKKIRPKDKWCPYCAAFKTVVCRVKKCLEKKRSGEPPVLPPAKDVGDGTPVPTNPPSPPAEEPRMRKRGHDAPAVFDFQDDDPEVPNLRLEKVSDATGAFATQAIPSPLKTIPKLDLQNKAPTQAIPSPRKKQKKATMRTCKFCKQARARPCMKKECRDKRLGEEAEFESLSMSPPPVPRPRGPGKRQPNMDGNSARWYRERQYNEEKAEAKRKEERRKAKQPLSSDR